MTNTRQPLDSLYYDFESVSIVRQRDPDTHATTAFFATVQWIPSTVDPLTVSAPDLAGQARISKAYGDTPADALTKAVAGAYAARQRIAAGLATEAKERVRAVVHGARGTPPGVVP